MSQFQGIYICDQSADCGDLCRPHNSSLVYGYMNLLLRQHQGLRVIIALDRDISRARCAMLHVWVTFQLVYLKRHADIKAHAFC